LRLCRNAREDAIRDGILASPIHATYNGKKMRPSLAAAVLLSLPLAYADVRDCQCDPAKPETMAARECGLCREAEKQPLAPPYFFLKDINPRKPNRLLILPRAHIDGPNELRDMTSARRTELWTAAIAKARELWGDKWGLAINGDQSRTQCHAHIHIGRLLEGIETKNFVVVDGPAKIPVSKDGSGLWVHPEGKKFHVHLDEMITETVLLR
jgi:diadenosine tetraphosphate (Ap4A) HIT family hydrolase